MHGCDGRSIGGSKASCTERIGSACAYSYVTPMRHFDDRVLDRFRPNRSSPFERRGALGAVRRHALDSLARIVA